MQVGNLVNPLSEMEFRFFTAACQSLPSDGESRQSHQCPQGSAHAVTSMVLAARGLTSRPTDMSPSMLLLRR